MWSYKSLLLCVDLSVKTDCFLSYQTTSQISFTLTVQHRLGGDSVCHSCLRPHLEAFFQNYGGGKKGNVEILAPAIKCCDPEVTGVVSLASHWPEIVIRGLENSVL